MGALDHRPNGGVRWGNVGVGGGREGRDGLGERTRARRWPPDAGVLFEIHLESVPEIVITILYEDTSGQPKNGGRRLRT